MALVRRIGSHRAAHLGRSELAVILVPKSGRQSQHRSATYWRVDSPSRCRWIRLRCSFSWLSSHSRSLPNRPFHPHRIHPPQWTCCTVVASFGSNAAVITGASAGRFRLNSTSEVCLASPIVAGGIVSVSNRSPTALPMPSTAEPSTSDRKN